MKRIMIVLICLLFAMVILFPAGVLVSNCFGYNFKLVSIPAVSIIIALLSVCTVVFHLIYKDTIKSKTICVLLAVLLPLSLVNVVFYLFECSTILVTSCLFIFVICCFFLSVKYGKPLALKTIALVLSALMVMPISTFSFFALVFGNIGQDTVVQTVESPNGKYIAEVIDSNQGALGGDTFVDVYEQSGIKINAIIFKIEKKPQQIYCGDWGEFKNMKIYWKDDGCLIINSVEYKIE